MEDHNFNENVILPARLCLFMLNIMKEIFQHRFRQLLEVKPCVKLTR